MRINELKEMLEPLTQHIVNAVKTHDTEHLINLQFARILILMDLVAELEKKGSDQ